MKELFDYIENNLTIVQGEGVGTPFKLLAWQKKFIRNAFKPGVHTAALTIGRGNGKTALVGAIAAAAVNGPIAQQNVETVIVASSFQQAKIAFRFVRSYLQPAIDAKPSDWRVSDSENHARIQYLPLGTTVRAVASDARRAHGIAPVLVLADEPAQWLESSATRMLAALETSLGKIPNSRMIALGTQAESQDYWFQAWLNGAADYSQIHAAKDTDNPYRKTTWKKANPSLDAMPSLEDKIRSESKRARIDETLMQSFRALRLNLAVSDVRQSVVIEASTWRKFAETESLPLPKGSYIYGVDLSQSAAMSSIAAYEPISGRLEVIAAFPAIPDLLERGKRDAVGDRYVQMQDRGELVTLGARTVDVAALIDYALIAFGAPDRVVCDAWRQSDLADAMDLAGLKTVPIIVRRMGFKDGSDDLRRFRRACVEGKIRTPVSLLMRSALEGARTVTDVAGNAKLARARETAERKDNHRDDAVAAAHLAVAEGVRNPPVKRTSGGYRGYV